MLALCSMLRHTYYAQNYAGIIRTGLLDTHLYYTLREEKQTTASHRYIADHYNTILLVGGK